jgi:hypothetical protein
MTQNRRTDPAPEHLQETGIALGMSLRDAAALAALQGTLANPEAMQYLTSEDVGGPGKHFERLGRSCFRVADAFIAAREAKTDGA